MRQIAHGGDPFETGSARPLDFGHWSAHKLETLTNHHLRHGEAVAIGMALDARYSVLAGLLAAGQEERICALLEHLGFRLWHPALEATRPDGSRAIFEGLREFREHLGGELTVTLLAGIGRGRRGARDRRGADAAGDRAGSRSARRRHEARRGPSSGISPIAPTSIPARAWPEVMASLERHLPAVRREAAPDRPFGVGLRLSAQRGRGAERAGRARASCRRCSPSNDATCSRSTAFPTGPSTAGRSRSRSISPTGATRSGVAYSDRLADLLAALLPDEPGLDGSVSTVPGTFKPLAGGAGRGRGDRAQPGAARGASGRRSSAATGRTIALALEPEPCCLLETIDETVGFFEQHLFGAAAVAPSSASSRAWRAGAAEAGAPAPSRRLLRRLPRRGRVRGPGRQPARRCARPGSACRSCSSAPRCGSPRSGRETADQLRPFDEPVYLHQVVERKNGAAHAATSTCRTRWPRIAEQPRQRVARAFPRADLPRRARGLLDHPGVPRRDPAPAPRASRSRSISRSRPIPGTCCRSATGRSTWRARSRASSAWVREQLARMSLADRAAARPGLQPADGLDQHAGRDRAGGRRGRRRRGRCRCWWRCRCSTPPACI